MWAFFCCLISSCQVLSSWFQVEIVWSSYNDCTLSWIIWHVWTHVHTCNNTTMSCNSRLMRNWYQRWSDINLLQKHVPKVKQRNALDKYTIFNNSPNLQLRRIHTVATKLSQGYWFTFFFFFFFFFEKHLFSQDWHDQSSFAVAAKSLSFFFSCTCAYILCGCGH